MPCSVAVSLFVLRMTPSWVTLRFARVAANICEHIPQNIQSQSPAHSSLHTFRRLFPRSKVRNWPENYTDSFFFFFVFMNSDAKTSLIWLHTDPAFPFFFFFFFLNRRNAHQFGILDSGGQNGLHLYPK